MKKAVRGIIIQRIILFLYLLLVSNAAIQAAEEKKDTPQILLEIKVLDKTSNEPIPGVQVNVRVVQKAGGDLREKKVTDESGQCSFPIEDKIIEMLRLEAVKDGYAPVLLSLAASETNPKISTQQTLYLDKGTKIGGTVQDAQGKSIEGAAVSISLQSTDKSDVTAVSGYEQKTDSNGLWVCGIIPEKTGRVTIRFTHPNYRTENIRVQNPSPIMQMLREISHTMIMQKQWNITGQVLDVNGVPIAGALVAQGADRSTLFYPSTKTDTRGNYVFENVTPGEMFLTVQAAGYSPDTIRFVVDKQMSPILFRLERGRTITGRVVDPNGKPVPDAAVSADTWRSYRSLTWETATDANGGFVWNDAPADEVSININKRRYIIIRNYVIKPSAKDFVITLMPELIIHGVVVDANSGEPINDFRFYPGVEGPAGKDISWKSGSKITKRNNYEMRFTYPSSVYYIRVEAEGYEPEVSRAITGSEGNVVLDFKLKKILPVTDTVLSGDK